MFEGGSLKLVSRRCDLCIFVNLFRRPISLFFHFWSECFRGLQRCPLIIPNPDGPDTPVLTKDTPKDCVGGGDAIGQTVRLTCLSDSLPPALFSWQRDGQPVVSNQPDSGVLLVQTFSTNDSGRFVCVARNGITGNTSEQGTDLAIVGELWRTLTSLWVIMMAVGFGLRPCICLLDRSGTESLLGDWSAENVFKVIQWLSHTHALFLYFHFSRSLLLVYLPFLGISSVFSFPQLVCRRLRVIIFINSSPLTTFPLFQQRV